MYTIHLSILLCMYFVQIVRDLVWELLDLNFLNWVVGLLVEKEEHDIQSNIFDTS